MQPLLTRMNHDPTLLDQHNHVQIPEEHTWFEIRFKSHDEEKQELKGLLERMNEKPQVPLQRLFLVNGHLTSDTIRNLDKNGCSKNLQQLELIGTPLDDFTLLHSFLERTSFMKNLRLVGCNLSDEGLKELLGRDNNKFLEKLELLDLTENQLTIDGVLKVFAEHASSLASLKYLFLENNSFDEEEIEMCRSSLKELFPSLEIMLLKKTDFSLGEDEVFTQQLFKSINTVSSLLQQEEEHTEDKDSTTHNGLSAEYMYQLANILENPSILPFESKQVTQLYFKAALADYPPAQYHVGCIFFKNYCVDDTIIYNPIESKFFSKSNRMAHSWFEKAASHGYALALLKLAHFHEFGVSGVEQDDEKAFELTLRAAQSEDCPQAWMQLVKAMEYLTKAAENDHKEAIQLLARIYHHGLPQSSSKEGDGKTVVNDEKALYWFTRLCEIDPENAQAFYMVGVYHMGAFGEFENQDVQEAVRALTCAARLGHGQACYQLGGFWLHIQQNPEMSFFWFREGSRLGNEACVEALKQFTVVDSRNPDL
ncbi:hypothetical protein C9374_010312 [Naegleria lovaniensis]|uniref:Uncharacterized protein n=1 Tax=Naegleria lovaniensis TaxID=51637 RepID=A0AA88GHG1_NAELO|nr:uncharacterized protein C9374_010312 [Naegleria lovaniensis]KAG2374938.1 hypothetical protein C9374_010312 [Naegleria lovaniensis]